MNRIVLLSRLRGEVEPADYEKWVVETDYPFARGLTAIRAYETSRVENYIFGTDGKFDPPYDYVEVIDVPDMNAYFEAMETEEGKAFLSEWSNYVDDFVAVQTTPVE